MARKSKPDIWVSPRDNGWAVKKVDADRASVVMPTQAAAVKRASQLARAQGGADVVVQGRDGEIRSKDTIGKRDPLPPRDTEH
jgi:hypothetical protein